MSLLIGRSNSFQVTKNTAIEDLFYTDNRSDLPVKTALERISRYVACYEESESLMSFDDAKKILLQNQKLFENALFSMGRRFLLTIGFISVTALPIFGRLILAEGYLQYITLGATVPLACLFIKKVTSSLDLRVKAVARPFLLIQNRILELMQKQPLQLQQQLQKTSQQLRQLNQIQQQLQQYVQQQLPPEG